MKRFLFLLYFFPLLIFSQEKDSLAKYNLKQLITITRQVVYSADPSPTQIYCEEILRRNPPDSIKTFAYLYLGDVTYTFVSENEEKALEMLKSSLKYSKKCNQYAAEKDALITILHIYVTQNKNDKVLEYIERLNNVKDPNETYLQSLIYPITTSPIYGRIGDFEKEASGYRKMLGKIEKYIASHHDIPKQTLSKLETTRYFHYWFLIDNCNYQKKLDSAAYYIHQAKLMEKKGYNPVYGIWHSETFYLILKGRYDDALAKIANSQDKYIKGRKVPTYLSLYYLALCWKQKKDYAKSLAYCEQAIPMKVKAINSFMSYDLELHRLAYENSEKLGDVKKTAAYYKEYIEISKKIDYAGKAAFVAKLYGKDVVAPLQKTISQNKYKFAYLYAVLAFLGLTLSFFIWRFKASQKEKKKFKETIAAFEKRKKDAEEPEAIEDFSEIVLADSQSNTRQATPMSSLADQKILKQLNSFERKQKFLSPNVSLSTMAGDFGTNVAYLSAAIKKHKQTNFNAYINELRIDYIIMRLKTSPEYSTYKIAYLAEECGFSSHTVFIRIFTEKTGLTPSKFISFLKTETSE
ncbi:helix-turn-helix transcriptional regulator [uncultured Flavobacterium sp.]|uniref:helix-turn-helix domain-containing protein n=1 Tax=uncultured Flavobacterium sp. TaxID=165435 RepID=UPI0025D3CDAE|nr:helix-turn-helix transcriptional regulator [uncultured Flavobacterium sp.]